MQSENQVAGRWTLAVFSRVGTTTAVAELRVTFGTYHMQTKFGLLYVLRTVFAGTLLHLPFFN